MTNDPHWQAPNELRFKAKFDKIAGLRMSQDSLCSFQRLFFRCKPNCRLAQSLVNDFLQSTKCSADDKQNMFCINRSWSFAAPLSEIHHCLDLTRDIIRRACRNFRLLHQFQEVCLDASA